MGLKSIAESVHDALLEIAPEATGTSVSVDDGSRRVGAVVVLADGTRLAVRYQGPLGKAAAALARDLQALIDGAE